MREWLQSEHSITLYHTRTGMKSCLAEAMNKRVMTKIYRVLYYLNRFDWASHLSAVQKSLNNAKGPMGYSPEEIISNTTVQKKVGRMYALKYAAHVKKHTKTPKYKVGTMVRYAKKRVTFEKGYRPQFSEDVRKIRSIKETSPIMYYLEGMSTPFYERQLSEVREGPTSDKRVYIVEKVREVGGRELRSGKKENSVKQYLTKSIADRSFSKWLSEEELEKLRDDGVVLHDASV